MKKYCIIYLFIVIILFNFTACNLLESNIEKETKIKIEYYNQEAESAKWIIDKIIYERIEMIYNNTTGNSTFPEMPNNVETAKIQIINLINNKKYKEAAIYFFGNNYRSEEFETLEYYAFAMWSDEENDYYNRNITIQYFLNPNYNGELNAQIKKFSLKYSYVGKNATGNISYIINKKINKLEAINIGITKFQVYNSNWGIPKVKSKTTTEKDVTEKWEYENNKYLIIKNDIVIEIHE